MFKKIILNWLGISQIKTVIASTVESMINDVRHAEQAEKDKQDGYQHMVDRINTIIGESSDFEFNKHAQVINPKSQINRLVCRIEEADTNDAMMRRLVHIHSTLEFLSINGLLKKKANP